MRQRLEDIELFDMIQAKEEFPSFKHVFHPMFKKLKQTESQLNTEEAKRMPSLTLKTLIERNETEKINPKNQSGTPTP